jgi:hypothetical protein
VCGRRIKNTKIGYELKIATKAKNNEKTILHGPRAL